ncbi:MAG: Uma2 family endonuclease [Pyrinomonadaceae bacterium]|nr:Uma2 family endonuclease [Pyrinomonadaceae bacterium]
MSAVLNVKSEQEWTAKEFYDSPLSKNHELVDGKLVKIMPAGFIHGIVANQITRLLGNFVEDNTLGVVVAAETGFILGEKKMRGADSAFVSNEKLAEFGYPEGFFPTAPDLAVEVASPNNTAEEFMEKVETYLNAESKLVWAIYPKLKIIFVHRPNDVISVLREPDELDGEDVLLDFKLSLSKLFGNLPETSE